MQRREMREEKKIYCINARINTIADMNLIIIKKKTQLVGRERILIELWIKILIIILLPLGLCVHAQNQHNERKCKQQ